MSTTAFADLSRFAVRFGAVAALACLPACGGPLDGEELADDEAAELESTEEGLGARVDPIGGGPLVIANEPIPSEMPVCQDCEVNGAVGLTSIGGVTHLTLRGVSAGTRMTQLAGSGTPYITTDDIVSVTERRLVNGTYQYIQVWSSPIAGFEAGYWSRSYNRFTFTYATSNGVTLNAQAMSLAAAPAGARVSANWKGANPTYRATVFALGNARGGGIFLPVPYVGP